MEVNARAMEARGRTKPRSAPGQPKKEKAPSLPRGWNAKVTEDGETYYLNNIDKTTNWTLPVPMHGSFDTNENESGRSTRRNGRSTGNGDSRSRSITGGDMSSSDHHYKRGGGTTSLESRGKGPSESGRSSQRRNSSDGSNIEMSESGHRRRDAPADQGELSSPLPSGWSVKYTKSGRMYYKNNYDNTSRWNKPTSAAVPAPSSQQLEELGGSAHLKAPSNQSRGNGSRNHGRSARVTTESSRRFNPDPGYYNDGNQPLAPEPARFAHRKTSSNKERGGNNSTGHGRAEREETDYSGRHDRDYGCTPISPDSAKPRGCRSNPSKKHGEPRHEESGQDVPCSERGVQELPPGWSSKVTADGKVFYLNNVDRTTSWNRPNEPARTNTSKERVPRVRRSAMNNPNHPTTASTLPRRASHSGAGTGGPPPNLPARAGSISSARTREEAPPPTYEEHMKGKAAQQKQAAKEGQGIPAEQKAAYVPAFAPASKAKAARDFAKGKMPSINSSFAKGMGEMMKRVSSGQQGAAKPPPKGYVSMQGGGFTNFTGLSTSDLKVPKKKKPSGDGGGPMGNIGMNVLNSTINSSLSMAGAGDHYKVKLKKNKQGGIKFGGKLKAGGSGSGSGSGSDDEESGADDEEEDDEGEVDVDVEEELDQSCG